MTSSKLMRRRLARACAGAVGTGLGVVMFVVPAAGEPQWGPFALLAAWLAMVPAYFAGSFVGRFVRPRDLEFWGMWLPMAAAAALLPMTLHMAVMAVNFRASSAGEWMILSGVIVGHVHLVLIGLCAWFVARMRKDPRGMTPHMGWLALSICVTVSCVPGVVLLALPPILTAVTGAAFIPWMFYLAHFWLRRERAEELSESLVHPRVEIVCGGLVAHSPRGESRRLRWDEPFRVALDREPEAAEGSVEVHMRLFQGKGTFARSVALTLALPATESLLALSAASKTLPRVHGPAASAVLDELIYHAALHGVELPRGLRPMFRSAVVASAEAFVPVSAGEQAAVC
jgi:hypothetical protein